MVTNPLPGRLSIMSAWRSTSRPNHEGIDLGAPIGTPVCSVLPGVVRLVTGNVGDPGNSIIVQHDADTETRYNHLRYRPGFKLGDRIDEGQQIGVVGMTGKTTAPHLHFARYELRKGRWVDVDPRTLLNFAAVAGGNQTPFNPTIEEEDMPVIIYEGPDSQAAKKLGDIRTGKAIRSLTAAEGHALRKAEARGAAVFITLTAAEFKKL